MECKCIEFVAAGWCAGKWLKRYKTIDLTSDDMGIPIVVVRLGLTGLKKIRLVHLLDLFEGRGEKSSVV